MAVKDKRGRRIFAAGVRTVGRGMLRTLTRSEAGAHWAKVGEDWYQTLGELKGAAMKLGQLASQYHDLLPPELAQQLARLQSSAEPLPWEVVEEVLHQQWLKSQWNAISEINPEPLASASIGQVHTAWLKNGTKVAVKVRYPGVAAAMDSDIKKLGRILSAAGILQLDKASLAGLLAEIRERMAEEMDYQREREHLELFAGLPGMQGLVVPAVVGKLCTEGVLVTEFAEGEAIDVAQTWPQPLRDAIAARYVDWLIAQIFEHGIVHADPHPGNFKFREDGTIVLLDFGCVKRVSPQHRGSMAALMHTVLAEDYEGLHYHLGQLGGLAAPEAPLTDKLQPIYVESAAFLRERMLEVPYFDFSEPSFIPDARAIGRRALPQWRAFKPIPELAFVMRALSGAYWLLRRLESQVDIRARVQDIPQSPVERLP